MSTYINDDFLLSSDLAKELFHNSAKNMPIFDFNNHFDAKDIYEDKRFKSITEAWLGDDRYKWRMMRTNGYTHEQITGTKTNDIEKFQIWANTIGHLFGNALYQWSHLELKRFFDVDELLKSTTCTRIYQKCNEQIKTGDFSVRNILKKMNVDTICTKNSPTDNLEYHSLLAQDKTFKVKVLPTFNPGKTFWIQNNKYSDHINELSKCVGIPITNLAQLKFALKERLDYFIEHGCVASDHVLETVWYKSCDDTEADKIFKKGLKNAELSNEEIYKFQYNLGCFLGQLYTQRHIVMQVHIGALWDVNSSIKKQFGNDCGFDCVDDRAISRPLVNLLDHMSVDGVLPKSIFHTLNDSSSDVMPSIIGCFQDGSVRAKLQFGTAMMSQGNISDIRKQISMLANTGMISEFIGTTNDARCYLSFPRHEYFRRVLCNYVSQRAENGEFPHDIDYLKELVANISFNNAKRFFSDRGFTD